MFQSLASFRQSHNVFILVEMERHWSLKPEGKHNCIHTILKPLIDIIFPLRSRIKHPIWIKIKRNMRRRPWSRDKRSGFVTLVYLSQIIVKKPILWKIPFVIGFIFFWANYDFVIVKTRSMDPWSMVKIEILRRLEFFNYSFQIKYYEYMKYIIPGLSYFFFIFDFD